MAIFPRLFRTFRETSVLAKAKNVFTIGGDHMAYPQAKKSCNGLNIFNATIADGRNKGKVAAHQGSYLANSAENLGHHCYHTLRYNNFGLFAPLGAEQTTVQLPVYAIARRFYRHHKKKVKTTPDRNRNIRDHKRRLLAEKYELRRNLYKSLYRDPELPIALRMKMRAKLTALPKNSSFTRVRNRCVFSGRPRGVYKKFRMSRIVFRTLANQGELMGVKKSSW